MHKIIQPGGQHEESPTEPLFNLMGPYINHCTTRYGNDFISVNKLDQDR